MDRNILERINTGLYCKQKLWTTLFVSESDWVKCDRHGRKVVSSSVDKRSRDCCGEIGYLLGPGYRGTAWVDAPCPSSSGMRAPIVFLVHRALQRDGSYVKGCARRQCSSATCRGAAPQNPFVPNKGHTGILLGDLVCNLKSTLLRAKRRSD